MLKKAILLNLILWLLIGLGSGLIMQVELLNPGRDIFQGQLGATYYLQVRSIHCAAMIFGVTLSIISLAALQFSSGQISPERSIWSPIAFWSCALANCLSIGSLIIWLADPTTDWNITNGLRTFAFPLIAVAGIGLCVCALIMFRKTTGLIALCLILSGLTAVWFGLQVLIVQNIPDNIHFDTWFVVCMAHTAGTVFVFGALAVGYMNVARNGNVIRWWIIDAGLLIALFAAAFIWLAMQGSLGLNGMPNRYVDYNPTYETSHIIVGVTSFAVLGLIFCLGLRLHMQLRIKPPHPADAF